MLLTSITLPVMADETEPSSCSHGSTVTREEAGEAPTCTSDGSHTVITVCEECGQELSRTTVTDAALGHQYNETARKDTSCGEAGSVTYTCIRCGDHYDEELPAPEHDYRKTETAPDGSVTFTCSLCGDTYTEEGETIGEQAAFVASGEASDAR